MADYSDDYGHPLQRHIERRMQETKERPQTGLEIEYRRGIIFKKNQTYISYMGFRLHGVILGRKIGFKNP